MCPSNGDEAATGGGAKPGDEAGVYGPFRLDSTPPLEANAVALCHKKSLPVHTSAPRQRIAPAGLFSCFWSLFCPIARCPACAVLLLTAFEVCQTTFSPSL